MHCSLSSARDGVRRYAISMRALIFSRLMRITSCSAALYGPKRSQFCGLQAQQPGIAVGRPALQIHLTNAPETISEGQKSEIFLGGMPPDPPIRHPIRVLKLHTGTPLFKILDPPLHNLLRDMYKEGLHTLMSKHCNTVVCIYIESST